MLIEDGYGKTFFMRTEDYLTLTDEQLQSIIADNYGSHIEDPFAMSFSLQNEKLNKSFLDDEELDEEEIYLSLYDDELDLDIDADLFEDF